MKITNRKMLETLKSLGIISQKELPIKISYAILKNINKIESELKIYNKERLKLIDKYAKKDDKGKVVADKNNQIQFKKECIEDWKKDITELLNIEVDVDVYKFSPSELNGFNMSPAELITISYMIQE